MKWKLGIIITNLLLIFIVCMKLITYERKEILSVSVFSEKDWENLCRDKQEKELEYSLYFDDVELPWYCSENEEGYLVFQPEEAETWVGEISVSDGYHMAFLDTEAWKYKEEMIREMKPLPFLLYNEKFYCKGNLFITNLPVMSINTKQAKTEEGTERFYGDMCFFGWNGMSGYQISTSACEYHVRGSASRVYYKMGYRLSLMDEQGLANKISMAGMRKDDDWILRAMGLDESKIREKLATDLWNEINEFGSYQAEYIELFLNGDYQGVYLLQEPMDYKTLNMNSEENFLVQMKTWPEDSDFWGDLEQNGRNKLQCGEFIIDKKNIENLEEIYLILEEYKRLMEGESGGELELFLDEENLYKLDVFLQTIVGMDNTAKNQFIVISRLGDNSYRIRKLPWDMDASFGQMLDYCVYEDFSYLEMTDRTIELMMECMPDDTSQGRKEMYFQLRDSVLKEEKLAGQAEELYMCLEDSGVLKRENDVWGKQFGREQTEFVKAFIFRRLEWMDAYYASL